MLALIVEFGLMLLAAGFLIAVVTTWGLRRCGCAEARAVNVAQWLPPGLWSGMVILSALFTSRPWLESDAFLLVVGGSIVLAASAVGSRI